MLEQQQIWMVKGLQKMYNQLLEAGAWSGPSLIETNGSPPVHDILSALHVPGADHDDKIGHRLEESCQALQSKLLASGAELTDYQRGKTFSDLGKCQQAELSDRDSLRDGEAQTTPSKALDDSLSFCKVGDNLACQNVSQSKPKRNRHFQGTQISEFARMTPPISLVTYPPFADTPNQLPQFTLQGVDQPLYQAEWALSMPH